MHPKIPAGIPAFRPSNTAALSYLFSHAAIPVGVIGYSLLQNSATAPQTPNRMGFLCVGLSAAAALALAALLKLGGQLLPQLFTGPTTWSVARTQLVTFPLIALTAISMMLLLSNRKSALVMGLMLTLWSRILELAFVTTFDARFSVAWYSLRTIGLVSASFLLVMFLPKTAALFDGGARVPKNVSRSVGELREEVTKAKRLVASMRNSSDSAAREGIEIIQRRINDAERILAKWDAAGETLITPREPTDIPPAGNWHSGLKASGRPGRS